MTKQATIESHAIYAALAGGLAGFLIGLVFFNAGQVALFERGLSLGFITAILGGLLATVTYGLVAIRRESWPQGFWPKVVTFTHGGSLALVHGLLAFLMSALWFFVVSESFIGARLDVWAASVITALFSGLTCYVTYLSAKTMTATRISVLLALFLLSGTFISMMTAGDPKWWYYHFSSLGANGGVSAYAFNATLIIAGVAVMALAKYITDDFARLGQAKGKALVPGAARRVLVFRVLLSAMGLALAAVGAFVYDAFPLIHNTAASGMAIMFLAILLALPWLMPQFQRGYFVGSYMLLGALLISVWLFIAVGYFNLTVFELVATGIIFTWLIIFVRHLAALLGDANKA